MSSKRLKKPRRDQVYPKEKRSKYIGDKPVQKVVIVKSGEVPIEEGGFHVEL